jgi:hypothetical protein
LISPPEQSGSDLLVQSAGLLVICQMREETTRLPAKIAPDGFFGGRFIGKTRMTGSIVKTVDAPVKGTCLSLPEDGGPEDPAGFSIDIGRADDLKRHGGDG